MPTILSHPAVAIAAGPWFRVDRRVLLLGAALSVLPDADVGAFGLGIPYAHPLGHRGFTHSLVFAALGAAFASWAYQRLTRRPASFVFLFLCLASHGLFDAMTSGGRGVGFFIPFSNERHFLPWRPIQVSPIGVGDFLASGLPVLASEVIWVWVPCVTLALAGWIVRRR